VLTLFVNSCKHFLLSDLLLKMYC